MIVSEHPYSSKRKIYGCSIRAGDIVGGHAAIAAENIEADLTPNTISCEVFAKGCIEPAVGNDGFRRVHIMGEVLGL